MGSIDFRYGFGSSSLEMARLRGQKNRSSVGRITKKDYENLHPISEDLTDS